MMNDFVVGLRFDDPGQNVLLIKKNRPEWQRGKFNGVGGFIEPNEGPFGAMVREFKEETGLITDRWSLRLMVKFRKARVYYFTSFGSLTGIEQRTDEVLRIFPVHSLNKEKNLMPDLKWIIPMVLDVNLINASVQFIEGPERYNREEGA